MLIVSTSGKNGGSSTSAAVARVLHSYAQNLAASLGGGMTHLTPPASTALAVRRDLAANTSRTFMFFGHGVRPPGAGFVADCGNVAVDASNIGILGVRSVVATSCYGDAVGAHASTVGFSMFGYVGRFEVPLVQPYIGQMEPAVTAGPRTVASGGSVTHAASAATTAYSTLAQTLFSSGDKFAAILVSKNASAAAAWP